MKKLYILGLLGIMAFAGLQGTVELSTGTEFEGTDIEHKVIGEVLDAANLGLPEGSTDLDQVVGAVGKEGASKAFIKAVEEVSPSVTELSTAGEQLHALATNEKTENVSLTQELKDAKQKLIKWIITHPKEALETTMQAIIALMAAKKAYDAGGSRGVIEHGLGFEQGVLGSQSKDSVTKEVQQAEWEVPLFETGITEVQAY